MDKTIEVLISELAQIRVGRAASAMVENLKVEVYGSVMPLNQLATIHVPDATTIVIQPWDASNVAIINKAFLASNLNLTPVVESNQLRINIPSLTSERRTELVKIIKSLSEESKISIRNIRKEVLDYLEKDLKDKNITEDEHKHAKERVESIVKEYNAKVDAVAEDKVSDISNI